MSRIENAFINGKAFIGFLTAGDPSIQKTEEFILEMARGGADLIEIGIPFSDPVAEGSVIQEANLRALSSSTTPHRVFELVASLRQKTDVPLVFLTYVNPVYNYGYEKFFSRCQALGVDGIIMPDLPFDEKDEVRDTAERFGVDIISMIAPTSKERIQKIALDASGFIYIVSSMGVTGIRNEIVTDIGAIIKSVRAVSGIPAAVGFGIATPAQAKEIIKTGADGVIVGSAIVKIIEQYGDYAGRYLYDYVKSMKDAIN
ncbi:MAG: tryptophan synthase subunit alpha [Clostridiales bacterium]|jgi:tryptophan synthase alpha chain|nr:tryptophan synthase subunit alpha [Clostridiales bacterium]